MAEAMACAVVKELVRELFTASVKAYRCKEIAKDLDIMIDSVQPTVTEILRSSGVDMCSSHRQIQLRKFSKTLKSCKKLIREVRRCSRWDMPRRVSYVKQMKDFEKKIQSFLGGPLVLHALADVHHLRVRGLERMILLPGTDSMQMITRKLKVKELLFKSNDERSIVRVFKMPLSVQTFLARSIEQDEEVRAYFGNRVLFVTVSKSPNLKKLFDYIWKFISGGSVATRELVILYDVWTWESLDQLTFEVPGTRTVVFSRFNLVGRPRTAFGMNMDQEIFCVYAFGQTLVPSGFNIKLVKQIVKECKGMHWALKAIGVSLKYLPEICWQGALELLSSGDEAADDRVFAHMEAILETLDSKARECFLDLGAFPQDKKISLDVLINIWVQLHDLDEEAAFDILFKLSNMKLVMVMKDHDPRCGVLNTGYNDIYVMQHSVLRDLALHLSNRVKIRRRERLFMQKRASRLPSEWERNNDEPYNARIVSIHIGEMTEMEWFDMELPKAEVLIVNFSLEKFFLPPFVAKMGRLRALVIINNGMSHAHLHDFSTFPILAKLKSLWLERVHVPELSSFTVPFTNLHKLSLMSCKINNIFDQTTFNMPQIFPSLSDLTVDHCDDLVELPSTFCEITSLNSVTITNCPRFVELPNNLSKLTTLKILRLYTCHALESLPEEICELASLKHLDISQCISLSYLPEELGKVRTLERIEMRGCPLFHIPGSTVSLTSLRRVICDEESLWMWEKVQKVVPGLLVEAAETCFSLKHPNFFGRSCPP